MSVDRQTPAGDEVYLDHVGWFIPDVERASAAFERLGFVLTPFVVSRNADPAGGPPVPSGTGNRCAMLERGYLELIAAIPGVDTALARQHREAVQRRVGVHVIAFTVGDVTAAHAHLQEEGFAPGDPVLLRRPIKAADGTDAFAAFTVIRVPPDRMPEGRVQILTQETPDLIWQAPLIARESGIRALTGILLCVPDPGPVAARYGRFVSRPVQGTGDVREIELDRGRLTFATPRGTSRMLGGSAGAEPSVMAAVMFESVDLAGTRRFLEKRGIRLVDLSPESFCVHPDDGLGASLVVHAADPGGLGKARR
jgi:hypothetical protein